MDHQLPLKNRNGDIVGYSKVDKDDYDKFIIGFWHLNRGYASGKFGKLKGMLHRFIMNAKKGDLVIDHINHDKLDNRKCNLRFVTSKINSQNKSKTINATSKYFGVSKIKDTEDWICSLHDSNGKHITYRFKIEEHAAYCYDLLATEHYGLEAQTNNIEKPDNFETPTKKEKPIHKGVYKKKSGKYSVVIWIGKKTKNIGTFETQEEAIEIYNKKVQEIENLKEIEPVQEIKRNEFGQAIIETFNKKKEKVSECIVDDDKYYELIKSKWYLSLGYIKTHMNNTTVFIHRYLMNPKQNEIVDHINNNPLDNRISNLRICTSSENSHNRKIKVDKYAGVYKNKNGNYGAQITKDEISYRLGTYLTEEEAARAYDTKARELYGTNAKTNFKEIDDTKLTTSYQYSKENITTSKYRGVSKTKSNTYQVHAGRGNYVGVFETEEEAAKAYDKKAKELFGDKAILNFKENDDNFIIEKISRSTSCQGKKKRANTSSKHRGVTFIKSSKTYRAGIRKDKIQYNLGTYKTEEEAAKAYDKKALELYGNKATLNFF